MKCGIIRDLLPSYIDQLTCEDSNQEIENHLDGCRECTKYYHQMLVSYDKSEEEKPVQLSKAGVKSEKKIAIGKKIVNGKKKSDETYHYEDPQEQQKDLKLLKSFKRKRKSLIVLLCIVAAVAIWGVIMAKSPYWFCTMPIPYEKAQPWVDVTDDSKEYTYYNDGTEITTRCRGIYVEYDIGMLSVTGDDRAAHYLEIDGQEQLIVLICAQTSVREYLENKDVLGDPNLTDIYSCGGGVQGYDDYNRVDKVYYLDRNPQRTYLMTDKKILEWIEKYGHLVWSKE